MLIGIVVVKLYDLHFLEKIARDEDGFGYSDKLVRKVVKKDLSIPLFSDKYSNNS